MMEMCAQYQTVREQRLGAPPPDLMAYIDLKKETAGTRLSPASLDLRIVVVKNDGDGGVKFMCHITTRSGLNAMVNL